MPPGTPCAPSLQLRDLLSSGEGALENACFPLEPTHFLRVHRPPHSHPPAAMQRPHQ